MWGKPSTECDSLSFFKPLVPLLQVDCQTLLCLPTCTYKRIEQLVTTTHRLSLSVPVLPSVIVKETAIHEFTGLPVRQYAVNLTQCFLLQPKRTWLKYVFVWCYDSRKSYGGNTKTPLIIICDRLKDF